MSANLQGLRTRKMLRISLPYMVQMANTLDPLASLPDADAQRSAVWFTLFQAQVQIGQLMSGSVYSPYLRSSYSLADELQTLLQTELNKDWQDHPTIQQFVFYQIKDAWTRYRVALLADFGALEAYFIVQQGGYDTRTLIMAGELLFPSEMTAKVPETLFDAREAARCIAYGVPTSAGFHIFRVLEAVLRKYYAHVTGGAAPPKVRSIGVYLNALKQSRKGDPIVLASLKQIADLHRNPLIHPEAVLTMDEAISALGITRSAVTSMLAVMPVAPPTTATTGALPPPAA